MNDMKMYVWLLPVLFILHDMEEIIFARKWKENGAKNVYVKVPFVPFGSMVTTEDMAIAVYEELLLICGVSCYSFFTGQYGVWFGLMAVDIIHIIVIHIVGAYIVYRAYVPGFFTGVLTLIPCIVVLYKAAEILQYGLLKSLLYVVIALIIAMINIKFLHKYACKFSRFL